MASARQKSGKWYYRITVTNGDGSHKYIERGSYHTKREALEAGQRAEIALKDGGSADRRKFMSFNFLAEEWLIFGENRYKETTLVHYKKLLDHTILPVLGDYNLGAINYRLCQSVIDREVSKRTRQGLANIKGCMNQCLNYAVRCGYITKNPARDVSLPEPRTRAAISMKPSKESSVVSELQMQAIFKRFPEGDPHYIPLLLGYRCGLRIGEAFGVLIDDIDFKSRVLRIRRQVQYDPRNGGGHYFGDPKYCLPGQGRDVELDDETWRVLKRHVDKIVELTPILRFPSYYINEDEYLNTDGRGRVVYPLNVRLTDGTFVSPTTMRYVSAVIRGKLGTIETIDPDWNFHSLRHTHASECIAAGMSPVSVQNRLGHRSLQTTFQYYVHETETQVTESRAILGKMWR